MKVVACFLPLHTCYSAKHEIESTEGNRMSDLISYALLAGIFVITGLRMLIEKPRKLAETKTMHRQSSDSSEDF
jgi:hypothetical protein